MSASAFLLTLEVRGKPYGFWGGVPPPPLRRERPKAPIPMSRATIPMARAAYDTGERPFTASVGDRSTITVPVMPTHEFPILYAWSLQKYVNVPSVLKVQLNTVGWPGAPRTGGRPAG